MQDRFNYRIALHQDKYEEYGLEKFKNQRIFEVRTLNVGVENSTVEIIAEYPNGDWAVREIDEEDATLKAMVNSQKYGYREISIKLKRTEGAIKRRMLDLKMEKRPPKAENHNFWKQKEIDIVRDLWLKGYQTCIIAEYINRSALSINGMLERHQYFGDPPRKNQTRSKHGQN